MDTPALRLQRLQSSIHSLLEKDPRIQNHSALLKSQFSDLASVHQQCLRLSKLTHVTINVLQTLDRHYDIASLIDQSIISHGQHAVDNLNKSVTSAAGLWPCRDSRPSASRFESQSQDISQCSSHLEYLLTICRHFPIPNESSQFFSHSDHITRKMLRLCVDTEKQVRNGQQISSQVARHVPITSDDAAQQVRSRAVSIGSTRSICLVVLFESSRGQTSIKANDSGDERLANDCATEEQSKVEIRKPLNHVQPRRRRVAKILIRDAVQLRKELTFAVIQQSFRFNISFRSRPIIPDDSDAQWFCRNDQMESLKALILAKKASPFDTESDGWTLLHTAAYCSSYDTVRFLLDCGADTDAAELKSRKAGHFAKFKALRHEASFEQKQLARLLEPTIDFKEDFELSPILAAALNEYDEDDTERPSAAQLIQFADVLCKHSAPIDWKACKEENKSRSPLYGEVLDFFELRSRNASMHEIFHDLLERPDALQQWTPVLWTAYTGALDSLSTLLDYGADPSYITPSRRNIFHHAAESGNLQVVRHLFSHNFHRRGVDVNLADYWLETPLHLASEHTGQMVRLFVDHGADVFATQQDGLTPLFYPRIIMAPLLQYQTLAGVLTSYPCGSPELNRLDKHGRTPIFYYLSNTRSVKLLVQLGADLAITDCEGKNMLHHICKDNFHSTLSLMLDWMPTEAVNSQDLTGSTPLVVAFQNRNVLCVQILLRRSRILDTVDASGRTILHHAAMTGDPGCLQLVLSLPWIDLSKKDQYGKTAMDLAKSSTQCREMLSRAFGRG